jgi:3-phenylpropionate/cinnamic acid dioxygenase small subunit
MAALDGRRAGAARRPMTRDEAEQFLITEALLIDERRFDEWLALFAPDCLYWLPITDGDPTREPSLIYDDYERLKERIFRISETYAPAQAPASRTLHNITNVEVQPEGRATRLRCHLTLFEYRPGDPSQVGLGVQRVFAGHVEYLLEHGLIKLKKIWLLNRDAAHYNLTFIF